MSEERMTVSPQLELWQTEWCPASHRVRQRLTELGVSYTIHQVPVGAADRRDLRELTGQTSIPVLVADSEIVAGEAAILEHLTHNHPNPPDAHEQREKAALAHRKRLEQECPQPTAPTA
jgi:glutathione S-transferase